MKWEFSENGKIWEFGDTQSGGIIRWNGLWEGMAFHRNDQKEVGKYLNLEDLKNDCENALKKLQEINKKKHLKVRCTCGKEFITYRPNKKYCSEKCYKWWLKTRVKPFPKLKTGEPYPEHYDSTDPLEKRSEWKDGKWVGF